MHTMTDLVATFQTSREKIQTELDKLAREWETSGITTPVQNEFGDVDDDAVTELSKRL